MNSNDYDAFERLANLRRYGSRLKKVLAKRAMGMHVKPSTALYWLRSNELHRFPTPDPAEIEDGKPQEN